MPPSVRSGVAVLAAAALLAGCTSGQSQNADFTGAQREVADTIDDFSETAQSGDERRICQTFLARPLLDQLRERGADCVQTVEAALDDADAFDLTAEDVRVAGNAATARVTAGARDAERETTIRLVREGANWKLAELG